LTALQSDVPVSDAKGPKFQPQNTQGAKKKVVCGSREKRGPSFIKKGPKRGRNFLQFGFALKQLYFQQNL
jgi:hypothetical protein